MEFTRRRLRIPRCARNDMLGGMTGDGGSDEWEREVGRYGVWLHSWFGIPAFAGMTDGSAGNDGLGSGGDEWGW